MNKKNILIIVMLVVIAITSIAYSHFSTKLSISTTGNITSSWDVRFIELTYDTPVGSASNAAEPSFAATTATMSANLKTPGDSMTYRLTLKNDGDIPAVIENIDAHATGSGAIIFSITGVNVGDKLPVGAEDEVVVKIEFARNTTSQPEETTKTLVLNITAVQDTGQTITPPTDDPNVIQPLYLSSLILNNNAVYADNVRSPFVNSDTGIDFSQASSDENGKGLYYTSTNTENGRPTYYFRGDVQNNYVKMGKDAEGNDILWRIVRINEDGSIRIIKQDVIVVKAYNAYAHDNTYVGFMYGPEASSTYGLTHTNDNSCTIKRYIDTWYKDNIINYADKLSDMAGFCNDRSIAPRAKLWSTADTALGYYKNLTIYGATSRLADLNNWVVKEDAQPQFKCPQTNDLFTPANSVYGNNALTSPIGLITADEVSYAGGVFFGSTSTSYLANGSKFWTMSPLIYSVNMYGANMMTVTENGELTFMHVYNEAVGYAVRPVVNLKPGITVELANTSEPGTITNPYIINLN